MRKDVVAVPLTHDTPDAMATPHGVVTDWKAGECEPVPGETMPKLVVVERDYGAVAEKMTRTRPAAGHVRRDHQGRDLRGRARRSTTCGAKNGVVRGGVADGRPSLASDVDACEAILALSGTTNGHLATQGFTTLEKRTGVRLADLAAEHEGKQITFADTQGRTGPGDHLTGVVRLGEPAVGATPRSPSTSNGSSPGTPSPGGSTSTSTTTGCRRLGRDAAGLPAARSTCRRCSASPQIGEQRTRWASRCAT